MGIQHVVLVGAAGRLGPSILQALLESDSFNVSVLTRASSKPTYPSSVNVLKTDDDLPYDQLVRALADQDALVLAFSGTQKDNSIKLANAAFEAGVKHVIPADFGSCDSSDPRSLSLVPLYVNKKDVRDHLVELSKKMRSDGSNISWTSLITGHFFDYGLKSGLLSMDVDKCKAKVFDDGNHKFSATTLATIGLATARILQKADDPRVKNKLVYVQSIQTTQNDLISTVESVTGKKYEVEKVNSDAFVKENKDHLEKDKGNAETIEELVTVEGLVNADWTTKGDAFVVDFLGLPAESLDDLVRRALK
ncbi:hypothetical protein LTR70_004325 [Exophiala xenobiotica]|uniref:NmrA-like domain-containing protein n=1 Tax=Lithohypha guttulata TaxID=1690604 RepID=A0ABR0KJD0_9EURO|nr:hypothetical protein LTR24_001902 [Lithohypha guttulata]KAK5320916.1 hypothetical protein LTR70_004325 [Exophiala xenobiotica]